MKELPNRTVFLFELILPKCKVGKESLSLKLASLLQKQESKGMVFDWNCQEIVNDCIVRKSSGMPYANLFYSNILSVGDHSIEFEYEEKTDQQVMLPNISRFVYLLLLSVKTAERIDGGFDKGMAKCKIIVNGNADAFFYEKYSIFEVDYSRLLKYGINRTVNFEVPIEKKDDVYTLFNRFYQQFKATESMEKPFVTLVKNSFEKVYDEF